MSQPPGPAQRRCAVLGSPIAHSLSPVLHAAAYRWLGLDWEYGRQELTEPGLAPYLRGLDGTWRGLSLTMPLKEVALQCVDEVSATARLVRAVNTVVIDPDGHRSGDNTDVPGMAEALREQGVTAPVARASLLGGGATARSALASLAGLADGVDAYVRSPARAEGLLDLAQALGLACEVHPWSDRYGGLRAPLVVIATPAGATDDLATWTQVPAGAVLLDVTYHPWPTPAAVAWAARWQFGITTVYHFLFVPITIGLSLSSPASDRVVPHRAVVPPTTCG
jgi:shikimate dehydrogenase